MNADIRLDDRNPLIIGCWNKTFIKVTKVCPQAKKNKKQRAYERERDALSKQKNVLKSRWKLQHFPYQHINIRLYLDSCSGRDPIELDAGESHRVVVLVKRSAGTNKDGGENVLDLEETKNNIYSQQDEVL